MVNNPVEIGFKSKQGDIFISHNWLNSVAFPDGFLSFSLFSFSLLLFGHDWSMCRVWWDIMVLERVFAAQSCDHSRWHSWVLEWVHLLFALLLPALLLSNTTKGEQRRREEEGRWKKSWKPVRGCRFQKEKAREGWIKKRCDEEIQDEQGVCDCAKMNALYSGVFSLTFLRCCSASPPLSHKAEIISS